MKTFLKVMVLLIVCFSFVPAHAGTKEYKKFFKRYDARSKKFDVKVAEMYSDDANIRALQKRDDGTEKIMKMTSSQWKEMIKDIMPYAKKRGDISNFKNIKVEETGNRAKISASRYSKLKCFTDDKYYMIVEKSGKKLQIVEEYMESVETSKCKNAKPDDLAMLLSATAKIMNKQLPIMVDDDTRLDQAVSEGEKFQYQYTLVNYKADELDGAKLKGILQGQLLKQTCTSRNLKSLIKRGATVSYYYAGKDKKKVMSVDIQPSQCK